MIIEMRKRVPVVYLVFVSLFLFGLKPFMLGAQAAAREAKALRIDIPLSIDGLLDEPTWEKALIIGGFIQYEPEKGKPSPFKTIAKILYDDRFVYIGFLCDDPQPERIAARISRRDGELDNDDSVAVFLDTFLDRRNCYFFVTNPLGTQLDGRISENGRTHDTTWDGIWKSAALRTASGWSAEIAVDLNHIKFEPGENQKWGFNVGRTVPRVLEKSYWAGPLESPMRVSQYGTLSELGLVKAEKPLQVIPHVISRSEEERHTEVEAGLTARYAFSQTMSGHLTINPDFATIEADEEQVNLTRFELNLQEKRNFFLEGSEIYRLRIPLFYTRRISDIHGGLKLYGKSSRFEYSVLSAQTKRDKTLDEDSANFSVFRLKSDVFKSSSIGFLAANKHTGGTNSGTAGVDTSLYFTPTLSFTGQFAVSYGDYGSENIAFFLRPSYDSSTSHFHVRYTQIGERFGDNANQVGFIRDDNRRELDSALNKTFWLKRWGIDRFAYDSNYNIYWGLDGTLRSWKVDEELEVDLENKLTFGVEHHQEYKLYEKEFRNHQTGLKLEYNAREWQSAEFEYLFGRNFEKDFQLFSGGFNQKLGEDFSLQYSLTRLTYRPDPDKESTWIHSVVAMNYFTKDLFLKVFFQTNSAIDKTYIQALFVYRFQPPFGLIQLAYQKGSGQFGERGEEGDTLFIKVAYVF